MPVATQASLKGLTSDQLEKLGCRLCLNNTYHLYVAQNTNCSDKTCANLYWRGLKPGQATLDAIGGAHKLQTWDHNILTGVQHFFWHECRCKAEILTLVRIQIVVGRFLIPFCRFNLQILTRHHNEQIPDGFPARTSRSH